MTLQFTISDTKISVYTTHFAALSDNALNNVFENKPIADIMLPLAIGSGDPGRAIEGPMAIVILGGLGTSTLLNLLVLPALAQRFARYAPSEEIR